MDKSEKPFPSVIDIAYNPPENPSTSHRNIFLATLAAQLFFVAMGMVGSYPSPACADMRKPGSRVIDITFDEITWIASLPMLSGMFGNAFSGYVTHKFGRKTTLMFLSVSFTIGWLFIAYAPTVAFIYAGRILSGITAGMCTVAVPTYIVEISTVEIRGLLTASVMLAASVGSFTMTGFGIFLRWSWLAILGAIVVVSGAILLYFMPESPPWLTKAGRFDEALKGIRFLKGKNHDAMKEMKEVIQQLKDEPSNSFSLNELRNPGVYKPLLIAIVLMINISFCGYPAVLSYSVEVFSTTKISMDPNVAATLVVLVQGIATVIGSVLMDKAGRKVLYVLSGSVMTFSLVIFGIYSYLSDMYDMTQLVHWSWIPVFSLIVYLASFSLGFGPVPFVVVPELVPTVNRSFVMAVSSVTGSIFGFIIIKVFDNMRSSIGLYGTYWFYGVFTFIGTLFYLIFVPETKCRTIHDINKSFTTSKIPREKY